MSIVTVTKEADQHLSKIITEGNAKGVMLAVDGGGCAGLRYAWELISKKEETKIIHRDQIDLECPICMTIMAEPCKLSCNHRFCI